VFARSSVSWSQIARLTPSDGAKGFGFSVGISGDRAIVGAPGDDANGALSGSAYVFERSGTSWSQVAKLTASDARFSDRFGFSVAISGDHAVVGAVTAGNYHGAAYVFERSAGGWTQIAELIASDGSPNDYLGFSVAISGDRTIAGAIFNYCCRGSVYVFEQTGSGWGEVAKLVPLEGGGSQLFGFSIAMTGDLVLIGGPESAYLFERSSTGWSQIAKLTASDGALGGFGWAVGISGDWAIVGAPWDAAKGVNSGSAYVFGVAPAADLEPPVLTVPADMTVEATSPGGAIVTYSASATDNVDPAPVVSCDTPSGATFPRGSTVVTCTAKDAAGNTATASFVVTVVDTTPPLLSLPADFAVDATSPSGAVVSYTVSATDVASVPNVSCTPPSGSLFAIGTHTVSCTATDPSGNSTAGSFAVTIKGAEQQITELQDDIADLELPKGTENSLEQQLAAALSALAQGNRDEACGFLQSLISHVNAQRGKKISAADAAVLIAEAERIRAVLGC